MGKIWVTKVFDYFLNFQKLKKKKLLALTLLPQLAPQKSVQNWKTWRINSLKLISYWFWAKKWLLRTAIVFVFWILALVINKSRKTQEKGTKCTKFDRKKITEENKLLFWKTKTIPFLRFPRASKNWKTISNRISHSWDF